MLFDHHNQLLINRLAIIVFRILDRMSFLLVEILMGFEVELHPSSSFCSFNCNRIKREQAQRGGREHLEVSRVSRNVGLRGSV